MDGADVLIKGRCDWVLGYRDDKAEIGDLLITIETRARRNNAEPSLPQLLIYKAAVHEARRLKANRTVFGMVSDSENFTFAVLDEERKFHVSRTLQWVLARPRIIA
ncbi:MAG: hypothetical protein M4579_003140 [Chaenotheca gracillima]|nr:MAG: hypothetical protein M4579_003140 [Chaenotheca gracillima]